MVMSIARDKVAAHFASRRTIPFVGHASDYHAVRMWFFGSDCPLVGCGISAVFRAWPIDRALEVSCFCGIYDASSTLSDRTPTACTACRRALR